MLLLMVAKTRLFQTDEGAVYTSIRPEEMTIIVNCEARGFQRSAIEERIEQLSDEGSLHEPAFGWFRLV